MNGRPRQANSGKRIALSRTPRPSVSVAAFHRPPEEGGARRRRVVVTHWIHPEVVDYLRRFCDPVVPVETEVLGRRQCLELAADADALIMCMADRVDDDFLAQCPRLRVISTVVKGYDNFDAEACARRGVWLTVLPDLLTAPTAELAVTLAVALGRRIREGDALMRSGRYDGWRPVLYGTGLYRSRVGVVGMGRLGRAVARRLSGFEPSEVLYYDKQPLGASEERRLGVRAAGLEELMGRCQVVLSLLPLAVDTRHLIGRDAIAAARPGQLLVNVGRGSVVDEDAVAAALDCGPLGGYAADVFGCEDLTAPGHLREVPRRLLTHPRTLLTPHLGSAVDVIRRDMEIAAARQVEQALSGQVPDHEVTAELLRE
ncbi:NAD(P)-dependent oxidoreductase [Streptomyces sviceus]|uniref:NAD(P)-dependent oxidoreductase n=1 Tax=Streptomyces sviceus TaxID=285530 RepID=UPI00367B68EB